MDTRRIGFLQELCNKYGDFKVCHNWIDPNGDKQFSKHISVMECWHSEKGLWFLSKAQHRSILPCEIVLDIDNPEIKLDEVLSIVEHFGFPYKAYFTGSRGHHIHIKVPELATYPKHKREALREFLIDKTGCDKAKKSEVMIALENVPHWKTGQPKTLVSSNMGVMI